MTYLDLKQKLLDTELVQDSEYLSKYCELLLNNRLASYDSSRTNYHHIVPRMYYEENNLEVDNSQNNLCILLYKDHVLAHYYLAMAALNDTFKYKMAYAVRFVLAQISTDAEKELLEKLPEVQQSYELIAKDFSINNPSKKPENAKKISDARKGKIYIRKDNKSIVILPEELDKYLKTGWECGRVGNWTHSQKGKIGIVLNGENKLVAKEELDYYLSLGATIGHKSHIIKNKGNMGKLSIEARNKQATNRRGKIAIHHKITGKVLYIIKDDYDKYKQDYVIGTSKHTRSNIGRVWINNTLIEKCVRKEELEKYLLLGFTKGRLIKGVI